MAPDDRDRTFEKALARHLRYIAPSEADSPALGSSAAMSCPDAEILAAYHDGSLSAEERALWKQHVLACESCQLVLEHLATPLDVPVAAESHEPILATAALTQPRLQQPAASPARAAAPPPVAVIRPRKTLFRWLAPAGAIAAGLLAFAVYRESRPAPEANRVEIAENRSPAAATAPTEAAPSAAADAKQALPSAQSSGAAPQKKAKDLAPNLDWEVNGLASKVDGLRDEQRSRAQLTQQAPLQYAPGRSAGPRVSQQQQQSQMLSPALVDGKPRETKKAKEESDRELAAEGKALAAKIASPPAPQPLPSDQPRFVGADSFAPASPPKPSAAAQNGVSKARAAAAGDAGQVSTAQAVAVEPSVGNATQTVAVEASAAASALMMQAVAKQGPPMFGPPTGDALWRVGPAGSIERSADNGASWNPQSSGVTADLTTGFALSARVCWVVGGSGTILRTTDGGTRWIKIGSPVNAAIIGIRATDAFHATISFIDDPKTGEIKSFKTADGGVNWSPAANE